MSQVIIVYPLLAEFLIVFQPSLLLLESDHVENSATNKCGSLSATRANPLLLSIVTAGPFLVESRHNFRDPFGEAHLQAH